jgi:hypothetical protein
MFCRHCSTLLESVWFYNCLVWICPNYGNCKQKRWPTMGENKAKEPIMDVGERI